jgi:hypothetical protein
MIVGAITLWFATIVLVDGRAIVGRFETLQDCRTGVAYASVNRDVVEIHRDRRGHACHPVRLIQMEVRR